MKRIQFILAAGLIIGFSVLGIHNVVGEQNKLHLREIQLKSATTELKTLEVKYDNLNTNLEKELHEKNKNQDRIKQLENEKKELQQKRDELEKQLSAKREAQRIAAAKLQNAAAGTATAYAASATPSGAVANCGDNSYANYIYMHESGCRTHNPNGSGCDGIGQACPASKVIGPCGYDYACQNRWFTQYANDRYGGWAGAYNFWINNHWW